MELAKLATQHQTDKWNHHWYCDKYEKILRHWKDSAIHLLEIGIGGYEFPDRGGQSLKMWRDYFKKALIFGLDIYDKTGLDGDRITTFKGSQTDPAFLDSLKPIMKFLHLVIDDGSHRCSDIITAFENLFPWLPDGGIYIVEDTETSYWEDYGGNSKWLEDPKTTMNYFKRLADGMNWQTIPDYPKQPINDMIESITFYRNIIVITKGINR